MTGSPGSAAYSLEQGTAAVRAARAVIEAAVRGQERPPRLSFPEEFRKRAGVFTTLTKFPHGELRGCVGFAEPVLPLQQAIVASALSAALEDRRFAPVEPMELDHVTVEVSLLTAPAELGPGDRRRLPEGLEIGRHGLIVRQGHASGLLLPQVASDCGWSPQEFLEHACAKAGLGPDRWRAPEARVLTFEAEVFCEQAPRGPVARVAAASSVAAGGRGH
jgi:hypothetical protein